MADTVVSVVVPYGGDCPHRRQAWDWVRPHYETAGYQVVVGYGDPDRWCKADAIADALTRTTGKVLLIADADCYSERTVEAVQHVRDGAVWAVPYRKVHRLTETSSAAVYAGTAPTRELRVERRHDGIVGGGIVALSRDLYDECPMDRRFVGWGGEDHSFGYALETVGGPPVRLREICWHFWHPPQPLPLRTNVSGNPASEFLRQRYKAARGDVHQMRLLIGDGMAAGNATVTILRGTAATDAYGDPVDGTVTETAVAGAVVAPRQEGEIQDRGRAGVAVGLTLFVPPSTDITHDDQVRVDGVLYDIDGEPGYWASAFTGIAQGIEIQLRRTEG